MVADGINIFSLDNPNIRFGGHLLRMQPCFLSENQAGTVPI